MCYGFSGLQPQKPQLVETMKLPVHMLYDLVHIGELIKKGNRFFLIIVKPCEYTKWLCQVKMVRNLLKIEIESVGPKEVFIIRWL